MDQYITWTNTSHGPIHNMDQYMTWANTSHGPIHHMDQYITWTNTSHGPIHHMDRYITWTNTSHGPIHYMDQYITWTNTLHGPITRLVLHVYTMDTCSILCCKWYDSLIHLFHNSTVCLLNSWVYWIHECLVNVTTQYPLQTVYICIYTLIRP